MLYIFLYRSKLYTDLLLFASFFNQQKNRRLVILFRLLSSIPPLIGAMFVSAFPIPALLYIGSIRFASDHGLYQYETYYDGFGSSVACAWVVVAFSIFAMICITKTLLEG